MSTRRTLTRLGAVAGTTGLLTLGLAGAASAHVTVSPSTTAAGAYAVLTFSVPHGCDGSATTAVAIQIPEGINAVTPTRNPFWTMEETLVELDPPIDDGHGGELTERTSVVTYTAKTPLPDGERDTMELSLQLPEDAEGESMAFPVVQTCEQGETGWTEIAAEGQSEDDLDSPAPVVVVTAADGDGHGHSDDDAAAEDAGDDAAGGAAAEEGDAEPVSAETDGDATSTEAASGNDEDGNGLAVAGLATGVIGILVAGLALARTRRTA